MDANLTYRCMGTNGIVEVLVLKECSDGLWLLLGDLGSSGPGLGGACVLGGDWGWCAAATVVTPRIIAAVPELFDGAWRGFRPSRVGSG